ncbi:MAG: uracil phosphoribosyltransferase [Faecalicoccus sp.]|nr:uracil phosphoribosyltransferase [Faecalicoccus sp.]
MLKIIDHPLISQKITNMRKKETQSPDFRRLVNEVGSLMAFEVFKDVPLSEVDIETPLAPTTGYRFAKDIVVVPILRAGLGLVEGITNILPEAKIAHIGMYRDETTLEPHTYLERYPKNIADAFVVIVDPMLATGGSAASAIEMVKNQGVNNIRLMCLVGAPEGVAKIEKEYPDVDIYLGVLDKCLNEVGYILPGLGDAGDRIFGTD